MTIQDLKTQYENICAEYIRIFCEKHEMEFGGWVGDTVGGVAYLNDFFFDFRDIVLDINTDQPKNAIVKWYYDNQDNPEKWINYYSYTLGLRVKDV